MMGGNTILSSGIAIGSGLVSLTIILGTLPTGARADLILRDYPFHFSHLSPLITYTPAEAWTINETSASSTGGDATATVEFMGVQFSVSGQSANVTSEYSPSAPLPPQRPRRNQGQVPQTSVFSAGHYLRETELEMRNWTGSLSGVQGEYMNVTGGYITTGLPANYSQEWPSREEDSRMRNRIGRQNDDFSQEDYREWYEDYVFSNESMSVESAIKQDNLTVSSFFSDTEGAWSVIDAPTQWNLTEHIPSSLESAAGFSITPRRYGWTRSVAMLRGGIPFDSASLLSTNTTGAPLRFTAPEHASFVQWYGSVGEDQGESEMRLLPRVEQDGEEEDDDDRGMPKADLVHSLIRRGTAERPVAAVNELRMVAWLNPKVRYDIELVLLEEGKRADVQGVSFASFVVDIDGTPDNWVEAYNDQIGGGGLSGGMIALVVTVTIMGVIIVLGVFYVFYRRHKQKQRLAASMSASGGDVPLKALEAKDSA